MRTQLNRGPAPLTRTMHAAEVAQLTDAGMTLTQRGRSVRTGISETYREGQRSASVARRVVAMRPHVASRPAPSIGKRLNRTMRGHLRDRVDRHGAPRVHVDQALTRRRPTELEPAPQCVPKLRVLLTSMGVRACLACETRRQTRSRRRATCGESRQVIAVERGQHKSTDQPRRYCDSGLVRQSSRRRDRCRGPAMHSGCAPECRNMPVDLDFG